MSTAERSVSRIRLTSRRRGGASRGSLNGGIGFLAALSGFAVLYVALALVHPLPNIYPDENLYSSLATSLAHGRGLTWRGDPVNLRAALYVYAISPAWLLAHGAAAYDIAKVEGAIAMSLTAVPIWLLVRRMSEPWIALLIAALVLSGTWMVSAAGIVTETFALPFATASLAATVAAVQRPGSRFIWMALGFAALATAVRMQNVFLMPTIAVALAVDVVRAGRHWRTRIHEHARPLAVLAVLLASGAAAVALAGAQVTGGYGGVLGYHPTAEAVLRTTSMQFLALLIMTGFLPLGLVVGCALRPVAWRDPKLGPLLAVCCPTIVIVCLQSGFFLAGFGADWAIQRYVAYAVPLSLAVAVLVTTRRGVLNAPVAIVVAVCGLLPLAIPAPSSIVEQRAPFAVRNRVDDFLPHAGMVVSQVVAAALTMLLAVGVWALCRRRRWPHAQVTALGTALAACLVLQSATAWQDDVSHGQRVRQALPSDLAWVDHHSNGRVGVLISSTVGMDLLPLELFNQHIARVYVEHGSAIALQGGTCEWSVTTHGFMKLDPHCAEARHEFLVSDPRLHVTFYNELHSARDPHAGRLVAVSDHPRVRAIVITPCERPHPIFADGNGTPWPAGKPIPCDDSLDLRTWSDESGRIEIRFRGAPVQQHSATINLQQHPIPPKRETIVSVHVPAGAFHRAVVLDWAERSPSVPQLLDVVLIQHGQRTSLL